MKRIFLSLIVLFMLQTATSQTTLTEYLYITKGLIDDYGKGKDIKAGYTLVDLGFDQKVTWDDGNWRMIKVYSFKKGGANKAIAVEFSDGKGNLSYKCIPAKGSDEEIWKMSIKNFGTVGEEWNIVLARAFMKLAASKMI